MRRGALVRWVAALALVAATWSASAIGDPFHSAPGDPVQVGKQPRSVAIGDLNGDQRPDLAVANFGSDDVSVLLGTATGTFVPAAGSPLKVGEQPTSVAIGDLNGDQHPDLAVTNASSGDVSVLLGTATGTFVPAAGSPLKVGKVPISVAIGDLNGDQHPDLAVANLGSDDVRVLLGTGTGAFARAPGLPLKTGNRPISVVIGDLNEDQHPDLAVANLDSDDVTVLLSGVRCVVPRLTHKRLGAARRLLVRADCSLGLVTKPRRRGGRGRLVVVAQTPRAGRVVRAGSAVAVRLAPRTGVPTTSLRNPTVCVSRCAARPPRALAPGVRLAWTVDSGVTVYFCDPRSPWQRGSNENTNGLLRQYFPKRSSVAVSQEHLDAVAAELNGRPRKTLGWMTPAEKLAELTTAG